MTFVGGALAGTTGRRGSDQAANKTAEGFLRTLAKVPTIADFNRCTFPDHRRELKNSPWSGTFNTFVGTTMVWKSAIKF